MVGADGEDFEAAVGSLRKGIALDPKDAEGHLALGRVHARRKEYAAAWRQAREAERLGHPGARELLAELARHSKEPAHTEPPAKKARPDSR